MVNKKASNVAVKACLYKAFPRIQLNAQKKIIAIST